MLKQLPMIEPPVTSTACHAFLLSGLMHYDEALPWFYCNYIQMVMSMDDFIDFHSPSSPDRNPWTYCNSLHRDFIERSGLDILKLVVDCIDSNSYVYTLVEEFYIPHTFAYGKVRHTHDILVHGYDSARRVFYIAGYFSGKYEYGKEIRFEDYERAYHGIDLSLDYMNKVEIYNFPYFHNSPERDTRRNNSIYHVPHSRYVFDLELVVDSLEDYLYARNAVKESHRNWNNLHFVSGLGIYDKVVERLPSLVEEDWHVRGLHALYNHKTCMKARVAYMGQQGYLRDWEELYQKYAEIEHDMGVSRNLLLKFGLNRNEMTLDKLKDKLMRVKSLEQAAVRDLLAAINPVQSYLPDIWKLDYFAYRAR